MGKVLSVNDIPTAGKDFFPAVMNADVKNEDELFADLAEKLKFPSYFGENWNAVWDMLGDFSWIKEKEIGIIYHQMPLLASDILEYYIKLLADAAREWDVTESHVLNIYLPENGVKKYTELI